LSETHVMIKVFVLLSDSIVIFILFSILNKTDFENHSIEKLIAKLSTSDFSIKFQSNEYD
jgi:hypothetical protein